MNMMPAREKTRKSLGIPEVFFKGYEPILKGE
jgi:hypothetical protein